MFKTVKKWWKYWGAKFNRSFEQRADPAVQLEQALTEAGVPYQVRGGERFFHLTDPDGHELSFAWPLR